MGLAATEQVARDTAATPDDVDDDVGDGVPARGLHPVAGDGLAVDPGGAAVDEVVPLDVLALDGVVGPLHAGAEAVLGLGLLVLVLLVGDLALAGLDLRELVLLVRDLLDARVLARELVLAVADLLLAGLDLRVLVLLVGDLLDARVLARELVLAVRDLVVALDELEELPLVVGDGLDTGYGTHVLQRVVQGVDDGRRNVLAPALLLVGGGLVVNRLGRLLEALTERVRRGRRLGGRAGREGQAGGAERDEGTDGHQPHGVLALGLVHGHSFCWGYGFVAERWDYLLM